MTDLIVPNQTFHTFNQFKRNDGGSPLSVSIAPILGSVPFVSLFHHLHALPFGYGLGLTR